MSIVAKVYLSLVVLASSALFSIGFFPWTSTDPLRFAIVLSAAVLVAGLKIALPGVEGTISPTFIFVLFGLLELSVPETLLIAAVVTLIQCSLHGRRPDPLRVVFNVATMSLATSLTAIAGHWLQAREFPLLLVAAVMTAVFFVMNTLPVSGMIVLTERRNLAQVWYECYFWSLPYYGGGSLIVALMSVVHRWAGWQSALMVIPLVHVVYRSYRVYLDRLEAEKSHSEEVAALHVRTIEALALAIEAKDHTTHAHLRRVQTYAVELARDFGLPESEIEAVRAAALLHDIGKLAVPEHIISKPGRLTPEEFEKMKIHPIVGAEILDRVKFPYPVVPIVKAHHERWNGTGYPMGLRGEEIPMGARILAAVDCLDALSSERQYRDALPLDEAMAAVRAESGTCFDPRVVERLDQRYRELDLLARSRQPQPALSRETSPCPAAPAAGYEGSAAAGETEPGHFLNSIAAARQEVQTLFELAQDLGNSLSLDETLSVVALRLQRIVPWDTLAIYVRRDQALTPEFVSGDDFRLLYSLQIPYGAGVSGWVAANQTPIVNGNPAAEMAHLGDPSRLLSLKSALSVPLIGVNGSLGALTLYRAEPQSFTKDHLRILLAIRSKVALSIENALRFRMAETSATTDYLTGLANARSLFLHLDGEIARSKRGGTPVGVLVCDLDGFKQVNDRFGHLEGNRVLRAFAGGLKEVCREYDYVARMGGDEFVIILPGLTQEALGSKLDAFRMAARQAGIDTCGTDELGLSVGQAFFPDDGKDAEEILAEADRRMYREKQERKSRRAMGMKLWTQESPNLTVQ